MQAAAVILLSVAASILYGVLHDQVTAWVCVEYLTVGHPRVIESESPTLLAFAWGVRATWWVGLVGGVVLAAAARAGASRPKLPARRVVRPLSGLMLVMGLLSLVAGAVGWTVAESGGVVLLEPLASRVPREKHVPFLADLWVHSAAYLVGFLGILFLAVLLWRARRPTPPPPSPSPFPAPAKP